MISHNFSRQEFLLLNEHLKCRVLKTTGNSRIFLKKRRKKIKIWKRKAVLPMFFCMFHLTQQLRLKLWYIVQMQGTQDVLWEARGKQ
jgi:hypothetical protein